MTINSFFLLEHKILYKIYNMFMINTILLEIKFKCFNTLLWVCGQMGLCPNGL